MVIFDKSVILPMELFETVGSIVLALFYWIIPVVLVVFVSVTVVSVVC